MYRVFLKRISLPFFTKPIKLPVGTRFPKVAADPYVALRNNIDDSPPYFEVKSLLQKMRVVS